MNTPTLPELAAALSRELDPGETVRWSDRPDPRSAARHALKPALFAGFVFVMFATLVLGAAVSIWRDFHSLEIPPNGRPPTLTSVYMSTAVGVLLLAVAAWSFLGPSRAAAAARRTIYALTPTRVVVLRLLRGGQTRIEAIEPGHPLHIHRTSGPDGRGDVLLYPPAVRTNMDRGSMVLQGVADARNVERMIRETFDPPSGRSGG